MFVNRRLAPFTAARTKASLDSAWMVILETPAHVATASRLTRSNDSSKNALQNCGFLVDGYRTPSAACAGIDPIVPRIRKPV
jgi:hypothetical protein